MDDPGTRAGYGGLTVSVRLISPAPDLANFPDFADLPVSTTVGQIKLLIGNELAYRNRSPAGMRVIYRGRLLDTDEKTLAEVFGIPTIQETRLQVLHLVLRDGSAGANAGAARASNPPQLGNPFAPRTVPEQLTAPAVPVPAGFEQLPSHGYLAPPPYGLPPQLPPRQPMSQHEFEQHYTHPQYYDQYHDQYVPAQHDQPYLMAQRAPQAPGQSAGTSLVRDLQQQLLSRGQRMEDWQMRQLMHLQQQRRRQQYTQLQQVQQPQDQPQEQEEPQTAEASGQQETREHAHLTETMPTMSQRHRAVRVPPQETNSQEPSETATATGASPQVQHYTIRPNIFILESPSGPRAVLVGGSFQESVPIPQVAAARQDNHNLYMDLIQQHNMHIQQQRQSYENLLRQNMQNVEMLQRLQQLHLQRNQMHEQHATAQQRAAQEQADPAAGAGQQQQIPNLHVNGHHGPGLQPNNPAVGFLAAMWPHIWLITRLVLFIWWFTNPSASWTRWVMVILVATAVFIFNTGVLDGFADQIWAPVRAHLDGLVHVPNANGGAGEAGAPNARNGQNAAGPAGDANGAANGANGDPTAAAPVGRAGGPEPDPAQVAARLVAERRNNNGQRLREFARRLERIGIMFLASLAPGIAERHVALAEEREREERRRAQEAIEAAIAAAAEAQAQAEAAAAAAAAGEGAKTAEANEAGAGPGAPEEQPNLDDDTAAVDAQWQNEQRQQNDRNAAAAVP